MAHWQSPIYSAPIWDPPKDVLSDTCYFENDGLCDDGGPGSVTADCEWGTDCSDCNLRIDADNDGFIKAFNITNTNFNGDLLTGLDAYWDCDDNDPNINPAITEINDGLDNDCDGSIDNIITYGIDEDGDGYGSANDCDDTDPQTHPGIAYQESNPSACHRDGDGDGYGDTDVQSPIVAGSDCDDSDPNINPSIMDVFDDGIDNNCDSLIDNSDVDGDGFFNVQDCDDNDASVYPGALELCDGRYNDCNDNQSGIPANEQDDDGDGYVECDNPTVEMLTESTLLGGSDCDDTDSAIHPDQIEIYDDGIDQNCDGFMVATLCSDTCTNPNGLDYSSNGICNDGGANASTTSTFLKRGEVIPLHLLL